MKLLPLVAVAALVASAAPVAAQPAERTVRVSPHVPESPRGDDPGVAYVDVAQDVVRSGAGEAPLRASSYSPEAVRAAGPGRFVSKEGNKLFVAEVGEQPRRLADHAVRTFQVDGPEHERVVYFEGRSTGTWLTVRSIADGALVDRLRVRGGEWPLAFRNGEVWFARDGRTVSWAVGTDRVRGRGAPGAGEPDAIDLLAGVASGYRHGSRRWFWPVRAPSSWQPWRAALGTGIVLGWSPGGRYVALGRAGHDVGKLTSIQVRLARSGRLVRTFVASNRLPFRPTSVRWETGRTLLARISTTAFKEGLVRLHVDGSFERASAFDDNYLTPVWTPSGPTIWDR